MADGTSAKSKGVAWTDAERVALLFSIVDKKGGIVWKDVDLPPGRTQKACMHAIEKLRNLAKGVGDGGEATAPPKQGTRAGGKRATAEMSEDPEEGKEKKTKKTKKVKAEPGEEEA